MPRPETFDLPAVAPGTARSLTAYRYGVPGARPKAYVHASLHADELPGMMCAAHLRPLLDAAEAEGRISGEIVLVPVANPIGLAQNLAGSHLGRFAFEDPGTNFNRGWPNLGKAAADHLGQTPPTVESVRAALLAAAAEMPDETENEAQRKRLLSWAVDADIVLDMHCDLDAMAHIYGLDEQLETVRSLSAWIGAPVLLMEDLASGGAFDAANSGPWQDLRTRLDAPDLPAACFAVTVEFRGQSDVSDDQGAADARGIFGFLCEQGVVSGDPGPWPFEPGTPGPLEATDVLKAPAAGLIAWQRALGETVEAGDVIAEIVDPLAADPNAARTPVVTHASGLFFTRAVDRLARPGASVGKVFGQEPLAHRTVGQLLEN